MKMYRVLLVFLIMFTLVACEQPASPTPTPVPAATTVAPTPVATETVVPTEEPTVSSVQPREIATLEPTTTRVPEVEVVEWSWGSGQEMPHINNTNSEFVDLGDGSGYITTTTENADGSSTELRVPIRVPSNLITRTGEPISPGNIDISVRLMEPPVNEFAKQTPAEITLLDSSGEIMAYFNIETGEFTPRYETLFSSGQPIMEGVPGTWADDFGVEDVRVGTEQEGVARYVTLTGQVMRVYVENVPAKFSSSPPPSFIKPEGDYANVTWAVVQIGNGTEIDILVAGNSNYMTNIIGAPQGIIITGDSSHSPGRNIIPESTVSNQAIVNALSDSNFVEVQLRDWKDVPQNGTGLALQYPEWYYSNLTIARDEYIRSMGNSLHDVHDMQKDVFNQIVNGDDVSEQHVPFSYSILTIVTDDN